MNPKVAMTVLLDVIDGVVQQRMFIDIVIEERLDAETVKTAETRLCSKPHESPVILQDGIDLTVAESLAIVQYIEFHISRGGFQEQRLYKQKEKYHQAAYFPVHIFKFRYNHSRFY